LHFTFIHDWGTLLIRDMICFQGFNETESACWLSLELCRRLSTQPAIGFKRQGEMLTVHPGSSKPTLTVRTKRQEISLLDPDFADVLRSKSLEALQENPDICS
jgi:hypothetical protein